MKRINLTYRLLVVALMTFVSYTTTAAEDVLPPVEVESVSDFSDLARTAEREQKLIMLEVSASYCSYCVKLEEALIKPMLRSGEYENVLIRKVDIDGYNNYRNFNGQSISGAGLARELNVQVTPTLIFLNGQNQEVSKRIIGVNSLDFMGAYVDDAIEQGLTVIR